MDNSKEIKLFVLDIKTLEMLASTQFDGTIDKSADGYLLSLDTYLIEMEA
jgi:hypothetical protein